MILGKLFQREKLGDIISRLETNDRRTGKIAFIKAFELLPDDGITFIRKISELRNRLVHDVKNFNFNMGKFFIGLDKSQTEQWKRALTWGMGTPIPQHIYD